VQAFTRLAKGDFSVRLQRNFQRDTDDALAFFVNVIAEQLDRLMAERDRIQQSALLEATFESMVDGVLLVGPNGVIQKANGAMAGLLGVDREELAGEPIDSFIADSDRSFSEDLRGLGGVAPFRNRDTLFRPRTGEPFRMAVNGSPHRVADGGLLGIVLVARDDRDLRELEAQLQVADRLTTMGTLAAGVAHEINNPLAFLMSNLQFVSAEIPTLVEKDPVRQHRIDDVVKALAASQEGARRVRDIVRDLHTFSRAETSSTDRVDVNALVDSAVALVHNELRHHARLTKECGSVPRVLANEGRLVQVVLNLLQNAVQSIPVGNAAQHEIRIATETDPSGAAVVSVHDTGCGIPADQLPHIFDLFFTTKRVGGGTGLGLSICHRIVESLGGRIEAKSTVGAGSVFRVLLPAAPPETESERALDLPHDEAPARQLRVLVVDDERELCESIQRLLADHHVDAVSGAEQALALLAADTSYDVVLCDLLMPAMTGMDLHARLAASAPEIARRMVFMTGGPFAPGARDFLARVPNPRIEKPFTAGDLAALLGATPGG
jgi:PAS domain S-box-containing protein